MTDHYKTDHYKEAERSLARARETYRREDYEDGVRAAQVHATLAVAAELRSLALMADEALAGKQEQTVIRTIPWPPSDDLVEQVASALQKNMGRTWQTVACAVLDVIGGAGDE